jgi:serine/threonine-protein kinase RsbT
MDRMASSGNSVLVMPVRSDEDVVRLRQCVREQMVGLGFSLVDQTKLVTAASELARNTLRYGGGGESRLQRIDDGPRCGLAISFHDEGPGIADMGQAMQDGFTTGSGLGLGLGGARRLADEFAIDSAPDRGTTVKIVKWKPY